MTEKPDADLIRTKIGSLRNESWLGANKWWPGYLFHHTNISNAISILNDDYLLSRTQTQKKHPGFTDSASQKIIQRASEQLKDHVRFYFRPKTPTLYRCEGMRPRKFIKYDDLGAYCPIPIYFLFDSASILCRSDTRFSEVTLASKDTPLLSTGSQFVKLPFQKIYHTGRFDKSVENMTPFRHAEVIVPQRVSLQYLLEIWCRSQAEYDTFTYLLGPELRGKWLDKIWAVNSERTLFLAEWVFVDTVTPTKDSILFRFNKPHIKQFAAPFDVFFELIDLSTGTKYVWPEAKKRGNFSFESYEYRLNMDLKDIRPELYEYRLTIDGIVACSGQYMDVEDIPF